MFHTGTGDPEYQLSIIMLNGLISGYTGVLCVLGYSIQII